MSLDRNAARYWSKDRIMVEIRERQDEIRRAEADAEEADEEYASRGYKGVESGWWQGPLGYMDDLQKEIDFLKNLL